MKKEFFAGKKVLIMGLGRFGGGVDAAKFMCGAGAKVIVTDMASADALKDSIAQLDGCGIEYHLGGHLESDFENADIIVVNPAVPLDNKYVEIARKHGKIITTQINIFFQLCPATIIGITGSNGKSTTTSLTTYLLRAGLNGGKVSYKKVWIGGNIGNEPLLWRMGEIKAEDIVVLELSNFQGQQIELIGKGPDVMLLTNITPNHLDRHKDFEDYCNAKENFFRFQNTRRNEKAVSVFNSEDKIAMQWYEKYGKEAGRVCLKFCADDVSQSIREKFAPPGRVNLSNLAGAMTIAKYFGVTERQIEDVIGGFKALSHRLEFIEEIDGVRWYNDSKATTPESAITAIEAFNMPKIIIAGGYDKHVTFEKLGEKIREKVKAAILIGQTAKQIEAAVNNGQKSGVEVSIASSLSEAVGLARKIAAAGDVVLLSPACASYDMFDNFEQRGMEFARLVRELKH